jgi:hypothetical protein
MLLHLSTRSDIWIKVFLAAIVNGTYIEAVNTADSVTADMEQRFPELKIKEEGEKYGGSWE